jgi:hypothetical protein
MGDRANVAIKQRTKDTREPEYIYLYTHWAGSFLPAIVQMALERGQSRWGDTAYLTRIIFCEMVKDDLMDTTGYGISNSIPDNEHDIIYIDDDRQNVTIGEKSWSFEEFINIDIEKLLENY